MSVDQAREWVDQAESIVGFSGAGLSTESGIPDFRSPNGVWANNRTVYFDEFVANREDRVEYWRQKVAAWPDMRHAEPNAGHRAFVELARRGKLKAMITQNIDGLHERSGLPREMILELHGTTTEAACLSCGDRISSDEACERVAAGDLAPECQKCGGLLKPATISFGQPMPQEVMLAAQRASEQCNLFLAVGSSLVVQPAALLPLAAKQSGARLIIINRDPTPLDSHADLVLNGELGALLPELVG